MNIFNVLHVPNYGINCRHKLNKSQWNM